MAIMKTGKNEIIVMGGTHRAVLALEKILQLNDIKIPFAIFQEDYPWDEQWLPELKSIAEKNNIPYHVYKSDEKLSSETIAEVNKLRSKAIIGIGTWRSLLPSKFWKNTQYGYIGIHGTLLPEYRGFAGLNWYVINGEKECGMQIVRLDESIDGGDLVLKKDGTLFRKIIPLNSERTMKEIVREVEKTHVELVSDLIENIKRDNIAFSKQDETKATWTCHRGPEDGEINWNKTSEEIHNFIRGQSNPFPGAYSFYQNKKFYIWKTSIPSNPKKYVGRIVGKVVERSPSGIVSILTKDGILKIEEISVDGKKIKPSQFIKSVKQTLGYQPRYEIEELKERITKLENIIQEK